MTCRPRTSATRSATSPPASPWSPRSGSILSANFARRGLSAAWDGVRHRRGQTGSPRLEDVIASLEATVEHRLEGGDHEIVVGRVREVETSGSDAAPLVFWRGSYASLG
ncbi:MAG TPA: flavin reductase family protein [Streptosporangiaceae bacterium]|nr:flavin reductase family protein [Streptosporangiaceae bacterium]